MRTAELVYLEQNNCSGHCPVMTKTMTPAQVAKMAGCGRSSVMRALSSRELPGIRDNSNRWKIGEDDARSWAGQRPESDQKLPGHDRTDNEKQQTNPTSDKLVEFAIIIAEQRAQLLAQGQQLQDLVFQRDRLLEIIEKQSEARPVKIGFFRRLFGG